MPGAFRLDPDGNFRFALLEQVPGLQHGFGTRAAALRRGSLATVKQIHSARVLDAGDTGGIKGEGDAMISRSPHLFVGVKTADCVPILLADPVHHVTAAVHAGWRGTVQHILTRTLEQMAADYETVAQDVLAAIGPAIGPCCYEVGPEVSRQFAAWEDDSIFDAKRRCLDLSAVNRLQLRDAGLAESHIACADLCTKCESALFFSYRRDPGETGRMLSWIGFHSTNPAK